jgi:hypothetical protein
MDPLKRCARCTRSRPLSEFVKHRATLDGRGSYCRPCRRDYQRAYRAANPEKVERWNAKRRVGSRRRTRQSERYRWR